MRKRALIALLGAGSLLAFTAATPAQEPKPLDFRGRPAVVFARGGEAPAEYRSEKSGPSDDDIGKAVVKAIGALVLHKGSQPQPDDGVGEAILRAIARQGRDELIDSALTDLLPANSAAERGAVRNLVILALDGRMPRDRDRILRQLRRSNPDMANSAEAAEFLIKLAQAVEEARR